MTNYTFRNDQPDEFLYILREVGQWLVDSGQNLFGYMLDFCRAECLKRGIHELQLETDATRPALMQFYERQGFEPTHQKTISEFGQTFLCQYYVLRF